jgi:hypothetical protein
MTSRKIISASLEGMRVLVDEKQCELQDYNFASNEWYPRETLPWPVPRQVAEEWVSGWNRFDRFEALNALTETVGGQAVPQLDARRFGEPRL